MACSVIRAIPCRDLSGVMFVDGCTGEVMFRGRFSWGQAAWCGLDPYGDLRDVSAYLAAVDADGFPWGTL